MFMCYIKQFTVTKWKVGQQKFDVKTYSEFCKVFLAEHIAQQEEEMKFFFNLIIIVSFNMFPVEYFSHESKILLYTLTFADIILHEYINIILSSILVSMTSYFCLSLWSNAK